MTQLSLFGLPIDAKPIDRLFFALFPPPEIAAQITDLRRRLVDEHGLRGHPVVSERLHVTLHHINDYAKLPPDDVRGALKAGEALQMQPIDLAFDRVASFAGSPRKPMLVLRGSDGVPTVVGMQQSLAKMINRYLPKIRLPTSYTPHITMLYGDARQGDLRQVEQDIAPIRWRANEIVLVHSLLGQSRHIPLASWALTP